MNNQNEIEPTAHVDREIEIYAQVPKGPGDFDGPEGILQAVDGALYVSSGDGWIYRISDSRVVDPFAEVGGRPLGMAADRAGNLWVCEPEAGAVLRVGPNAEVSTVSDRAGGRNMRVPNFAVFDERGWLYVSDSGTSTLDSPQPDGAIFRISPGGDDCELFADGLLLPNGLAMRRGEPALYVAQSTEDNVLRLEIKQDLSPGEIGIFAQGLREIPDGIAFAENGDLLVVAGGTDTIYRVDQTGRSEILIQDPPPSTEYLYAAANCAFGGSGLDALFISNLGGFVSRVTGVPRGQQLYHQI